MFHIYFIVKLNRLSFLLNKGILLGACELFSREVGKVISSSSSISQEKNAIKTPKKFVALCVFLENIHDITRMLAKHSLYPQPKLEQQEMVKSEGLKQLIKCLNNTSLIAVPDVVKVYLLKVGVSSKINIDGYKAMNRIAIKEGRSLLELRKTVFILIYTHAVAMAIEVLKSKTNKDKFVKGGQFEGLQTKPIDAPNHSITFAPALCNDKTLVDEESHKMVKLEALKLEMTHNNGKKTSPLNPQVIAAIYLQDISDDKRKTCDLTQNDKELNSAQEAVKRARTNIDNFGIKKEHAEGETVSPTRSKPKNKWTKMTEKVTDAKTVIEIMHRCHEQLTDGTKNSKEKTLFLTTCFEAAIKLETNWSSNKVVNYLQTNIDVGKDDDEVRSTPKKRKRQRQQNN